MSQTQTPAKRVQGEGKQIPYTPEAAKYAGDIVLFGTIPLPLDIDLDAGQLGSLSCEGVFAVPKDTSTFSAGDAVYWKATANPVSGTAGTGAATSTASGAYLMGFATKDILTGDAFVNVKLSAAKRTATIAGSVTADDITGSDSSLGIGGVAAAQGGAIVVTGGTSSTSGNAGGAVSLVGGTPGATGVGGAAAVAGGAGGSTSGTGGAASLAGGAGTAGNANGGAVSVLGGNAHGSGTDGVANIGTSNTSQINIGVASIPTAMPGPVNKVAGASTAAAGTDETDAGALPAGTAGVYPTTAADDTKGVIVHTSDKVTGRLIFIGNGVSNKILKVYPPSGGSINGAAANAAFSSASGKGVIMYCLDSTGNTWFAW